MKSKCCLYFVLCWIIAVVCFAQTNNEPSKKIPPTDDPVVMTEKGHDAFSEQIEKLIIKAKKTYPSAKKRFLKGLPDGYNFYVTTAITDNEGHVEQVFVHIIKIEEKMIYGKIANNIEIIKGFHLGQDVSVSEEEIVDWTITSSDGKEEGNLIGKYIDSLQGK